jgi:3-deoxy-manno-octulosonate cytidylyltransferase (CMP-KDO synthetase)
LSVGFYIHSLGGKSDQQRVLLAIFPDGLSVCPLSTIARLPTAINEKQAQTVMTNESSHIEQDPASQARALCVIPARWASTRFPGKPLHEIGGKPLIQHVWERCQGCAQIETSVVATDHDGIAETVRKFGGEVVMTSPDHASGTDRVAEAARHYPQFDRVINVQGDEPMIDSGLVDQLAETLRDHPQCAMVTAANPLASDAAELDDPNVVKVVLNSLGDALYFSRSRIPFPRDSAQVAELVPLRHKGIYGFQRDFLQQFVSWPPSILERCEQLEQLRALENGATIRVILTNDTSPGIDTPEQAALLNRQLSSA